MHTHRITDPGDRWLPAFWQVYGESFPDIEQRTLGDHLRALAHPDFHCRVVVEGNALIALLCLWEFSGLRYVEHFALTPGARGNGLGSRILTELAAEPSASLLMLEIDPLIDAVSRRRLGFYERLGYVRDPQAYTHPPYQHGHAPYPLLLLSLHRGMTPAERASFERQVDDTAMIYALGAA